MTKLKGATINTGTVHYAKQLGQFKNGQPILEQLCGKGHSQRCYLAPRPEATTVTCKRCGAYDDK